MLFAQLAIVRGHPLAIIWGRARLHLVDEVAYGQRMVLRGTEDKRLFLLVDHLHELFDAVRLTFLDLNDLVEIGLRIELSALNLPLHNLVIWRVHELVEGRGNLLETERREESIVDP